MNTPRVAFSSPGNVSSQPMDLTKMLAELHQEREHMDEAIVVLARIAVGRAGKRRGRPPKWMTQMKRRGRPPGSKNKKP